MVIFRALRFDRQRQLRRLWTAFSTPCISGRNVGMLLPISKDLGRFQVRNVSSTAPVQAVGMTFLNKLFGRPTNTAEAAASIEPAAEAAAENTVQEETGIAAAEETGGVETGGNAVEENVTYTSEVVEVESAVQPAVAQVEERIEVVVAEPMTLESEAAVSTRAVESEALEPVESEAAVTAEPVESKALEAVEPEPIESIRALESAAVESVESEAVESTRAAESGAVEGITADNTQSGAMVTEATDATQSGDVDAAGAGAVTVNSGVTEASQAPSEPSSTKVQEFIDSLPPLPAPEPVVKSQAPEKPPEKPAVPPKLALAMKQQPKAPIPKVADAAEKTSEKVLAATIKPNNKPSPSPAQQAKKPSPTKPSPSPAADPSPVIEFLRQRLRDPNPENSAAAPEPPKPPPLKLSLSTVQKTNSAINSILDSVEKTGKSPSIFDALNVKHEEPGAPSLKLSLSSAPSAQPAEPTPMDAQTLMTEMNTRLTDGNHAEATKLFETWKTEVNPVTLETNKPDRTLYNLYMQAKVKTGAVFKELGQVLTEMEEAGLPRDLAGYNILIRALFRADPSLNRSSEAESILERMEKEEPHAQPDGDSYNLVVVLCALDRKTASAFKHMKTMIDKGFEPSRTTVNEVLLSSARTHQTQMGASLLKDLKASGKPLPMLNTCAELLMAASEVDDAECAGLALAAISERPMARFGPKMILDEGTMICVLGTAARTGDTVLCSKAWEAICSHTKGLGRVPSSDSFLARIHALTSTSGNLGAAFKAAWEFEVCYPVKGDAPSELFSPFTSLKCLASACSRGGAPALDAAYYKIEEAHQKKEGVALASLNCIILGCSNLWDSERAYQTFEAVENVFGLRPDLHTCNALLHALGRTKMMEDALKVYGYITEAGFKPNEWTYMLLTEAHVVNHDSNSALNTLQTMIDAGYRPLRQTTAKVWSRLKQYEDQDGLERLKQIENQLNYRQSFFANNRRKLLLDLIRSA